MNDEFDAKYHVQKIGKPQADENLFSGSPTMTRLVNALNSGTNIGDYGRLAFTLVARHFMSAEDMILLLGKQPGIGYIEARALVTEVAAHDYSPPPRSQLIEWQSYQNWPICPDQLGDACDFYAELEFPQYIYDRLVEEQEHVTEQV